MSSNVLKTFANESINSFISELQRRNLSLTEEESQQEQQHQQQQNGSSDLVVILEEDTSRVINGTLLGAGNVSMASADVEGPAPEDLSKSVRYSVIVPILMVCCLITFCMNAYIIAAFPLIRNLSRVSDDRLIDRD